MNGDELINALDSVTWYNGLAEEIIKWKNPGYFCEDYGVLSWNWDYVMENFDKDFRNQIEIIWMICVRLFGDYGTSPRSGWIEAEKKDDFYAFVDKITETYQEDLKYNGETPE